jgi:glutamine synthetase
LPATLDAALKRMDAEPVVKSWLPPVMYESYLAVKRKEIELCTGADAAEICRRYHAVY